VRHKSPANGDQNKTPWIVAITFAVSGLVLLLVAGHRSAALRPLPENPVTITTSVSPKARYVRLEALGHGGVSEVMTALGYIRHMANEWDLERQDQAGRPMVDDGFLAFLASKPGFVTFAEFSVMYEMLFAYNFDGAMRLAKIVLEQRPESTVTAYALAFMLDRVFGDRSAGGAVLLEATRHRDLPQWVTDLAQRMIRNEPDPPPKDPSQPKTDFFCDFVAKMQRPEDYPLLLRRCHAIGTQQP
jgi:hypothetical protein